MRPLESFNTHSRGFSLIEVMVALVVLSIGLLGVAKMEALSLSSTTVASMRSLAAIQASSLAASMHENRGYWTKADPSSATIKAQGATVTVTAGAPLLAASLAAPPNCNVWATPCSVADTAAFDLQQWANALQGLLPNDTATIACNGLTPIACTVNITWSENAVAVNAQAAAAANSAAQFQLPSYTLYVEP